MDVQLSADQRKQVIEWLNTQVGSLRCPVCATEDSWVIGEVSARLQRGMNTPQGYPVVVVVCSNCAYTLLFNALLIGLDQPDAKPESQEADDG